MKLFTEHPVDQGFTYFSHYVFAAGIALRLLRSALAFVLHAVFPFVPIAPELDLEATSAYVLERNRFVEQSAQAASGDRDVRDDEHPVYA